MTAHDARPAASRSSSAGVHVGTFHGAPALVIIGVELLDQLALFLDRAHDIGRRNTGVGSPQGVQAVASAARHVSQLAALLTPVPQSEPARDSTSLAGGTWVTTQQAATALKVSDRAVRKRIAAGTLQAEKRSGVWLIKAEGLTHAA